MIVIDDSPEVDHELFEAGGFESDDWVLISEEIPVDEHKRDDLVERFQQAYQSGAEPLPEDDVEEKDELEGDEEEDEDELDGVEGL